MKATAIENREGRAQQDQTASHDPQWILRRGRDILAQEARAIQAAASRLDEGFGDAVRLMLDCKGIAHRAQFFT